MKKYFNGSLLILLFLTGCSSPLNSIYSDSNNSTSIIDDGSSTNYTDSSTAAAKAQVEEDLFSSFSEDGTLYINFSQTGITAKLNDGTEYTISESEVSLGKVSDTKITALLSENTIE